MILSIDASFTSSGVSLHSDDGTLKRFICIKEGGSVYKSNAELHQAARRIVQKLIDFIGSDIGEITTCIVEIPAPNQSGFYLAMLHGWVISTISRFPSVETLVTLPPMACNSFIKNKERTKSYIVKYAKEKGWVPDKRINNDIATAVVLTHCYLASQKGDYKNTVNKFKF